MGCSAMVVEWGRLGWMDSRFRGNDEWGWGGSARPLTLTLSLGGERGQNG